jgi:hypothetical protein
VSKRRCGSGRMHVPREHPASLIMVESFRERLSGERCLLCGSRGNPRVDGDAIFLSMAGSDVIRLSEREPLRTMAYFSTWLRRIVAALCRSPWAVISTTPSFLHARTPHGAAD